jgi:Putative prokaryotic signal transducing protein
MRYVPISVYDNYIPAHIALGRLTEEYINCYLQDEYSVTIDPFLSNAIGGIKLMVAETQAERALEILNTVPE